MVVFPFFKEEGDFLDIKRFVFVIKKDLFFVKKKFVL
jgi:hypothetical protein